jgi:2-dehydro-3-deoxyphosphogluconate aldolase / (4S)-4-hydroxy-2-oxoglutarate aldolase
VRPPSEIAAARPTTQDSAVDVLQAGAFALGVRADLVDTKAIAQGRAADTTANATKYLNIVRNFNQSLLKTAPATIPARVR